MMLLFSPQLPDGTCFKPLAASLLQLEDLHTKLLGKYTRMPLETVLQLYYGSMNRRGNVGLRTGTTQEGSLSFGSGTDHLSESEKQSLQQQFKARKSGRDVKMQTLTLADYAHIDEEAGVTGGGGHWAVRMEHMLQERHNLLTEPEEHNDSSTMAFVRKWTCHGPQTKKTLELEAEAGNPVAMLKLADILMCCGYGITNETRDPQRACKLYYDAAGYGVPESEALPEAMIAVALICKGKLLGTQWQKNQRPLREDDVSDP
eukprot:4870930-Prymnesium_polylepis.1